MELTTTTDRDGSESQPDRCRVSTETAGYNCFKIFATTGSRNSVQTYSRQYEHRPEAFATTFPDGCPT
ncbi:hypothetical protein E5139_16550 (plasmid) [Halomicrobium mukohataei]|uniref:Uncharacterized protein n=2 Tax=Halomicrobium mukohataei TaxID=57705 RepID=C7P532_HALMD|nr:hypothetical protein Hmuk_3336 [Halomicrobium mukohataei DSM 12286]QCD67252.1 hypothetical protein E5139_16550 [Halomicrobium mukohataei]